MAHIKEHKKKRFYYLGVAFEAYPTAFYMAKCFIEAAIKNPMSAWWLDGITEGGKQDEIARTFRKMQKIRAMRSKG